MVKVTRSEDCGNSPKNLFIQSLAIALAKREIGSVLGSVSDDIRWHVVGKMRVQGKPDLVSAISSPMAPDLAAITVHHVVTHGKAGCVNGTLQTTGGLTIDFCDVFEFTGARGDRVKAITSYRIEGKR
jgi:hypothetical protein